MRLPELPEHEARYVRDYVNSQSHGDEAGVVQKVGSRRVMGRVHDMYGGVPGRVGKGGRA
jgi:hypothetical protein